MWHCVVGQVGPDVSEYRSALIFMVKGSTFFTNVRAHAHTQTRAHTHTHINVGKFWGFDEVFFKLDLTPTCVFSLENTAFISFLKLIFVSKRHRSAL